MAKKNQMLARIEAAAEAKYANLFYRKMRMCLQMGQDAAMIAANDVLHMGEGRAKEFCTAYIETVNEIARMMYSDQKDDVDFLYTKTKVDERIKSIVGEANFEPWEVRYGEE